MTSLGVACKDDIPASRWEFLLRNPKQTNRVYSSQKDSRFFIYKEK